MCFFALVKIATEHGARLRRGRGRRGHVFVAVVGDEIEHLHVVVVFRFFLKLEAYLVVEIVAAVTACGAVTLAAGWCRGRLLDLDGGYSSSIRPASLCLRNIDFF